MDNLHITEIPAEHTEAYKKLVQYSLVHDHACFRISPNDALDIPFSVTKTDDLFTLGAYLDKELVGVVTFKREGADREKLRHKGVLSRMIVSEKHRGKGIAGKLIEVLIARARSIEGIEQINLTVIPTNARAKLLYERFGFETYASEKNAIKWKGQYYTEDQMVLFLE